MRKERTNLELRTIKRNDGQLEWLPKNPRQWTQTDIDRTAERAAAERAAATRLNISARERAIIERLNEQDKE